MTDSVYNDRKDENIEKNNNIQSTIKELEVKRKGITSNINNLLPYPDLLKAQNDELQEIKKEIENLKSKKKEKWERLWLERFKNASNKILTHLDKLVLQKENPEVIQIAFDIIYGGKIEYENILSHTPITQELSALQSKKELQLNWNSSLNRKWWGIRGSNPGPSP